MVAGILWSCSSKEGKVHVPSDLHLTCSMENVNGQNVLGNSNELLPGASARSQEKARSGNYSLQLSHQNPYALTYTIANIRKGSVIEIACWKNADAQSGSIVLSAQNPKQLYESTDFMRETDGDWGRMSLMYIAEKDFDSLTVYVYNDAKTPVFFDDFSLDVYYHTALLEPKKQSDVLRISIPKSAEDSLSMFRKTSVEEGVISDDEKQYVNAFIELRGTKVPIEVRLKGDWTDHVESDKWSLRIKMGDGEAYEGMRTFSIQNPSTRSFMMEWFAHKLFEQEGILTTRFQFVPVVINGKNKGVYALEEHFDKQLLESRSKREGPILKFDESGIWQIHEVETTENLSFQAPVFESAEISVFKKNRTKKNPVLLQQFVVGQQSMDRYRKGDLNYSDYMDTVALAKYMALSEVLNAKHGLIWHNQRFYYNPVLRLLEPIAYDAFAEYNLLNSNVQLLGLSAPDDRKNELIRSVLKSKDMRDLYQSYLKKYSDPAFLDKAFQALKKEIHKAESLLSSEYPNIHLDESYFRSNCRQIRKQLPALEKLDTIKINKFNDYKPLPANRIFTKIALKSHVETYFPDGSVLMSFENFHSHPIEIIGYSVKPNKGVVISMNPIRIEAYGKSTVRTKKLPAKPRRIFYKAGNCGDKIFKCNPEEWGRPKESGNLRTPSSAFKPDANDEIHLKGKLNFSTDIVIPNCKRLVIEAGTEINLTKGASLVSYAPLLARGIKEKPIRVYSSDLKSSGVHILSSGNSEVAYATFDGLGTMKKSDWTLTGAVTFYGAQVKLRNSVFTSNRCEDGLNLIRCTMDLKACSVENAASDGFDADFCRGTVDQCMFSNTVNDCIDFSGSRVEIKNCTITNAGDKGISGGERSQLAVNNCTINGAHIGVASKDQSRVTVEHLKLIKAHYGFAAYRKKPEYGPAIVKVLSMDLNKAKHLKLIEVGSKLIYQKKEYTGTRKFDIDSLYAMYRK